ncbi:MAG: hypothetical protein ACT4N4_05980 [Rhodospirillales bacterium]
MSGNLAIGSEEHKRLFCRTLIETHDPYDAGKIRWPAIDDTSRRRIAGLPFWNDAMFDERNANAKLELLAETQTDPLLKQAIGLQGREEGRHARIIEGMLRAYDIPVDAVRATVPPKNPEWAFVKLGYGECFDSFFSFGMFKLAERSGFFPKALVGVFEPIVQEEARHILFFQNWIAYVRANRPVTHRPMHRLNCARGLALTVWSRVKFAFELGGGDKKKGGEEKETFAGGVSLRAYLETCLAENKRRLAPYDQRLLRPTLIPSLVRQAVKVLPRGRGAESAVGAETA